MNSYKACDGYLSVDQTCGIARNFAKNLPKTFLSNDDTMKNLAGEMMTNENSVKKWNEQD
jgi:hypothetical protein